LNSPLRFFLLTALFVATLLGSLPAQAQQDYEHWLAGAMATRLGERGEWRVVMGAGAGLAPEYRGADDYEGKALPLVDIEWRGAYFASTQRGLGVNIVRQRSTRAGPRITYDLGRDTSDSTALIGLADVDLTVEAGVFAEHFTRAWRIKADLRMGLNGHEGIIGSFDVALGGALADRTSLIIGGKIHAADEKYMQAYFGVPAGGTTNFTFFQPKAGLRDITGYATMTYVITDNIYVTLDMSASLMTGDAADSPISISDDQYFVGTMIAYRF
tara:strand:+ start:247 stop:1059 length:813 start_codon:yes stop_codon:yes gene_type:complete